MDLTGRVLLITGGTQGVGRAVALAAADAGADLVIHGLRDDARARATIEEVERLGRSCALVTGDLSTDLERTIPGLIENALAANPDINGLVSNAGTYIDEPFLELSFDTLDRTMKLNVYSHLMVIQNLARHWVKHGTDGRIVVVGSINGRLAEQVHVAYDTSKGAVDAMVRSLCVSLAPLGLRVNGMAPGLVYTPLTAPALDQPAFRKWMELHTPNGRVPGPEVCSEAVLFLLSDAATHVQGQMLLVDGGMSAWQQPDPPDSWNALADD